MSRASVRVELGERSYDVLVGEGTLAELGKVVRATLGADGSRAFVVADSGLIDKAVKVAGDSLASAGFVPTVVRLTPSERRKSLETLGGLLEDISATAQERAEPVIALGGGIVGDVAGLVAALYRRGVPVVQCPTTLLAMVDASVGGKTAINLGTADGKVLRKNMAGVFHQPALVAIDVGVLDSLADREFRCGLAECVKHAMICADGGDPGLLEWTEANAARILKRDRATIRELVRRNVAIKARIVAGDERETAARGGRALLNLGHTFAHAIEPIARLSPTGDPADAPLLHGEAVALGLVAACSLGETLGTLDAPESERIRRLLGEYGLPIQVRGLPDTADLLVAMGHDKKVAKGRIRFIVPAGPERAEIRSDMPESAVAKAIDSIRGA